MIFPIRVTYGQEKIVTAMLEGRVKSSDVNVKAILYLENIKGYVFIEAESDNDVVKIIQKIRHIKGFINKPIPIQELEPMIKKEVDEAKEYDVGDIVEIKSGGMKGERAKIIKIDKEKGQLVVEPIEVAVPIPIKLKIKNVKLIEKKA